MIREDNYKDKIYIIGSLSQKETIKSTADYYIGTGRYRVRYVKEEPENPPTIKSSLLFSQ